MTLIHVIPSHATTMRRPINRPIPGPRCEREVPARPRRPAPSRPAGAAVQYRGSGVAMSVAPHRRRPATLATTVGLALLAGMITLWLGVVAHFGQLANDSGSAAHVPIGSGWCGLRPESRFRTWRPGWRPTRRFARSPSGSANSTR